MSTMDRNVKHTQTISKTAEKRKEKKDQGDQEYHTSSPDLPGQVCVRKK